MNPTKPAWQREREEKEGAKGKRFITTGPVGILANSIKYRKSAFLSPRPPLCSRRWNNCRKKSPFQTLQKRDHHIKGKTQDEDASARGNGSERGAPPPSAAASAAEPKEAPAARDLQGLVQESGGRLPGTPNRNANSFIPPPAYYSLSLTPDSPLPIPGRSDARQPGLAPCGRGEGRRSGSATVQALLAHRRYDMLPCEGNFIMENKICWKLYRNILSTQAPFLPSPGFPSSSHGIEIPGREVVACRPATTVALNTKFNMGPPILMLVTYPASDGGGSGGGGGVVGFARRNSSSGGSSGNRAVLYFHWSGVLRGGGGGRKGRRRRGAEGADQDQEEEADVRALVEILRVKEEWVKAIHQVFFPLRSTLVSKAAR